MGRGIVLARLEECKYEQETLGGCRQVKRAIMKAVLNKIHVVQLPRHADTAQTIELRTTPSL